MMNKEEIYWIWFSRLQNLNIKQKEILLNMYKTPKNIWDLNEKELSKIKEINNENISEILSKKYRTNLDKYLNYMNKENIKIITIYNNQYPQKLNNIYDKPYILFAKGNLELLNTESIAIVGCRNCTEYGKNISKRISYNIAKNNKCIISGLARGVDTYAHLGALEANGKTIAVVGNGLDTVYPYENKNLYERILKNNGLIISEYIIGTKPDRLNFPMRNRIISGLADGIVVVEAKKKSGSLITADFALEQGKDIFAIPGNINSNNSEGTNELIKQGCYLATDYKDILDVCYN